jgi:hypothetical protein
MYHLLNCVFFSTLYPNPKKIFNLLIHAVNKCNFVYIKIFEHLKGKIIIRKFFITYT